MKIDMTHKYKGAVTHTLIDAFKRRMKNYEAKAKVVAERLGVTVQDLQKARWYLNREIARVE